MKRTENWWAKLMSNGEIYGVLPRQTDEYCTEVIITYDDGIAETEEREVKRWVVASTGGILPRVYCSKEAVLTGECAEVLKRGDCQIVELTGKYTVPKVEKEKKRVEATGKVSLNIADCLYLDHLLPAECCGKSGKISFEWED